MLNRYFNNFNFSTKNNLVQYICYFIELLVLFLLVLDNLTYFYFTNLLLFISNIISYSNPILFLFFYFFISLSLFILNFIQYRNFSNISFSNNIYLSFLYYLKNLNYTYITLVFLNIKLFVVYLCSRLNFLNYLILLVRNNCMKVMWYPIFKRHSIFGYYRLSRQKWNELKSEEVNYIKY